MRVLYTYTWLHLSLRVKKNKTSTNLIISHVDHHQRQETEEEAAKDDEHHAGESQVIASLMFLWRTLFAALIFHWFDHRKVGFFLSVVSTRSGAVNLIKINFLKFKLQTFFFLSFQKDLILPVSHNVASGLFDFDEDASVWDNNSQTGYEKSESEEKLLWRFAVLSW